MPIVRSRSPVKTRSGRTDDEENSAETATTTAWSINTPAETSTSASTSTAATAANKGTAPLVHSTAASVAPRGVAPPSVSTAGMPAPVRSAATNPAATDAYRMSAPASVTMPIRTRAAAAAAAASTRTSQQAHAAADMQAPANSPRHTTPVDAAYTARPGASDATLTAGASAAASSTATRQRKKPSMKKKDIGGNQVPPLAPSEASMKKKDIGGNQVPPLAPSEANMQPKNIGGNQVPPYASSGTCGPRRTVVPGSVKSSRLTSLEANRRLIQCQIEEARLNTILAQNDVEIANCYQSEDQLSAELEIERSTQVEQWVEHTATYMEEPLQDNVLEPMQDNALRSDLRELTEAIKINNTKQREPAVPHTSFGYTELPIFNGAHEDWLPFKRAYKDSSRYFNDVQNMARLRKVVLGPAYQSVRYLMSITCDPEEVMDSLEENFGRPEQLVQTELEKIKQLPKLGDSPKDLCYLASCVKNAVTTIRALDEPEYLYSAEFCRSIVAKLSPIQCPRWLDFESKCAKGPELVKLRDFLSAEAKLYRKIVPVDVSKKKGNAKYPVHSTHEGDEATNEPPTSSKKLCVNCEEAHWVTECTKFREATVDARWEIAKQKHLCFRCLRRRHARNNCRGQGCKKCKRPHHTMLHSERTTAPVQREKQDLSPCHQTTEENSTHVVKSVYAATDGKKVYLKMIPVDVYGPKGSARILALLDEGSTVSLIDADIAAKIGATGKEESLTLETVGGKLIEKKDSQRMDLKIKGAHRRDKRVLKGARTVAHLKLSPQYVGKEAVEKCKHLQNMKNELLYDRERPALLIGQDNWELIVSRKILKGEPDEPVASLTGLGWVLHGYRSGYASPVNFVNHCRQASDEDQMDEMIKRHFDLEAIGIQPRRPSNDADGRALAVLEETSRRRPDGRFESGLLWKTDNVTLPNNYVQAHSRLTGIERKLDKNATLKEEYGRQLKHLLASGYAEEAPAVFTPGRTFYLPHFAVVHPIKKKKKTRIVFDAAARFEGKRLNDALLPGPDLLQSLFGVLLRFREGPVAVVADIKEMFLQIRIRDEDRDSLRYLWRGEDRHEKPKEYRMTSVIFGAASSPATAIFVKNLNAKEHEKEYPEAARAIVHNHYMDDYLQSFRSTEEAARTAQTVDKVHKAAGFELRQWASNEKEALRQVAKHEESPNEVRLGNEEEKTLGLRWLVNEDALAFNIGLRNTPSDIADGNRAPTKREVTSAVMSTFDPMGLVAPVLIKGKRLIQDIWRAGTQWDETINEESQQLWLEYIEDVQTLNQLKVPRCLSTSERKGQLHTFVDASETAYAAATYWRTSTASGEVNVALVAGKARVTPLKSVSIPRLELQAALLGARLAATIAEETDLDITERVYWSDSSTVLQWMKSDPRRFKPFVAHRLAELEDLTKPHEWRWVPTKQNPADDATRKVPRDFSHASRWFCGPEFLYRPESEWPTKKFWKTELTGEEKKPTTVATVTASREHDLPDPERFSSWTRLLRATARVFMFIDLCKKKRFATAAARDDTKWKPYHKKNKEEIFRPHKTKETKRWLREYLPTLMPRKLNGRSSTDPDVAIIADASLPRNTWPRGEVVKTYVGPDGRTRVVDVRTAGGVLRRPTSRLIIVVPAASRPELGVHDKSCTGGEIVSDAT